MDKSIGDKQEAGVKPPLFTIINYPRVVDYDTSDYFLFSTTNDLIPVRNDIKRHVITRKTSRASFKVVNTE